MIAWHRPPVAHLVQPHVRWAGGASCETCGEELLSGWRGHLQHHHPFQRVRGDRCRRCNLGRRNAIHEQPVYNVLQHAPEGVTPLRTDTALRNGSETVSDGLTRSCKP